MSKSQQSNPVSPSEFLCMVCEEDSLFHDNTDGDDGVDLKDALFDDPIIGVEHVLLDENGLGARRANPLASPKPMSPAEKAVHDLTHLPFHPGCPICRATRTPNAQHRGTHEHLRVIPLLSLLSFSCSSITGISFSFQALLSTICHHLDDFLATKS